MKIFYLFFWFFKGFYNYFGQFHLRFRANKVNIHLNSKIDHPEKVIIKTNVRIDSGARISGIGTTIINENTKIAQNFLSISETHEDYKRFTPFNFGKRFPKEINIGKNVWIGSNVIILAGSTIGDNCVVGAGSVLRGKFKNNTLILGNPAVVVKKLNKRVVVVHNE